MIIFKKKKASAVSTTHCIKCVIPRILITVKLLTNTFEYVSKLNLVIINDNVAMA